MTWLLFLKNILFTCSSMLNAWETKIYIWMNILSETQHSPRRSSYFSTFHECAQLLVSPLIQWQTFYFKLLSLWRYTRSHKTRWWSHFQSTDHSTGRMTRPIRYLPTLWFFYIQKKDQSVIGDAGWWVDGWDHTIKKVKKSTPSSREQTRLCSNNNI